MSKKTRAFRMDKARTKEYMIQKYCLDNKVTVMPYAFAITGGNIKPIYDKPLNG